MSRFKESNPAYEAYATGAAALAAGDLDAAILALERSIAEHPHFKALELLGEAFLRRGEQSKAIVALAAATTLNRGVRAPSLLAEALLAIGEELDAHEAAELALSRDPKNRKARAVLDATAAAYNAWDGA